MTPIDFIKLSPTQNMTVLVSTPLDRLKYADIANALMDYSGVYAEQVGFIEPPSSDKAVSRLQMMGGEFCGNATLSLAAWIAWSRSLPENSETDLPLEVSGAAGILHCRIRNNGDSYTGTVSMPLPEGFEEFQGHTVVRFPGICHMVLSAPEITESEMERNISAWCEALHTDALGILRYVPEENGYSMKPLVYVASTGSCVWERGCASGSAALAAWHAAKNGNAAVAIRQPGGTISVRAEMEQDRVSSISLTGNIRMVCTGTAWVDC